MAPPSVDVDLEAQTNDATQPQLADGELPPTTANPRLATNIDPQPQAVNPNGHHNGNPPAPQTADNSQVQRSENHGDSSDGLWSIYLTEAEKQDQQVIQSWDGDTNGILVFTGLFSATVAAFLLESYKKLSPDSGDTTNALLAQISLQLVNISSGAPLADITAQGSQPFKPTTSAVRVNVLWFLSLILSLNCALSATLMQQWARRYQELAQRRGATHRRGRMRAYIFDGITKFRMARAVATMPTLLHISVFLFFAGLVEFLIPIYTTVAYATLGCIGVFALAYALLTILPNIYFNCPYATPLSGLTWRIAQFSIFGSLWTILKIEGLFPRAPKKWREMLEKQVKMHRQWFSQGLRKSVELSAYRAKSIVVTSALEWTLTALDEDKEIEDFTARVPGFFDSRIVPDATSAVLSLMSHQPNTYPIFGSRLYDLLKTCKPGTLLLDEKMRKNRLRVCLKCLWYFGKAYNQLGASQLFPSYLFDTLASPETTRRVQTEADSTVRVIGRCFGALIVNRLTTDLGSRTDPISDGELACLSAILGTKSHGLRLLLRQPDAVGLANMISLTFDSVGSLVADTVPSDVLAMVRQTLDILSQALPAKENAKLQLDKPVAIIEGSDGKFERIFVSRLLGLLNTCISETSPLTEEERTSYLRVCLKGLWYFGRAFNQLGNSVPLPSNLFVAFANPEMTRRIREQGDPVVRVIGRYVWALVVNRLAADINSRNVPISDAELACLSTILGTESHDVMPLLSHPGIVKSTNLVFLASDANCSRYEGLPSDVLDMVQQTFSILSQAIPVDLNAKLRLNKMDALMNTSDGTPSLTPETFRGAAHMFLKNLWDFTRGYNKRGNLVPLPSYVYTAITHPEITRLIDDQGDLAVHATKHCVRALFVNKLAADINSATVPVSDTEVACLSTVLGTESRDVVSLLRRPGAIEFTNLVFLASDFIYSDYEKMPPDVLYIVQQTFSILSQDPPVELNAKMRLDQLDALMNASDGSLSLAPETFKRVLRTYLKNLWSLMKAYNERMNPVPLPSYIYIAFSHPGITPRMRLQGDFAIQAIGCCIGALVVNKLSADINSSTVPVSDAELACLSTILGAESHDVKLCLGHPGTVELVNLASLALGPVSSLRTHSVSPDARVVLQQTIGILSQTRPAQENAELQPDHTVARIGVSDSKSERAIVSRLHDLLEMCTSGASPLTEEVRRSCLRICLKSLWRCGQAYHGSPDSLPPYFPLVLSSPEIIRHFQTEQDPVARITGCCLGALIVNKLVDALPVESPILFGGHVNSAELACISAVLGIQHREDLLWPLQILVINFRNLVSLVSGEIDTLFTATGAPADVLNIVEDTLYILAIRLNIIRLVSKDMPMNQQWLLQEIYSKVKAQYSDRLKDQTMRTLNGLRQIMEKLLLAFGIVTR